VGGSANQLADKMEEWSATLRRWEERVDYKPDDETEAGMKANLELVCHLIDSLTTHGLRLPRDCPEFDLEARDVLEVNVAFYRYEMFNVRPPPCLGVDSFPVHEGTSCRDQIDCDDPDMRRLRCSFSMDFLTDGIALMLKEYDEVAESMRAYSNRCVLSKPLPRDFCTLARKIQPPRGGAAAKPVTDAAIRSGKWRTPKDVCPYAGGVYARTHDEDRGPLNVPASSVAQLDALLPSTAHARRRLVATLCWFRRHAKHQLEPMIVAMAERAIRSAELFELASRMRSAAELVAAERARRSSDPFTLLVAGAASEELGEALWPYIPAAAGPALMQTCKALHGWGKRFRRALRLRLDRVVGHDFDETRNAWTALKGRRIALTPVIEFAFLEHWSLPTPRDAHGFVLKETAHPIETHGGAVDVERSSTRAALVFDDAERTPVPNFGRSALTRFDGRANRVGALGDKAVAHFPKGRLPKIVVSTKHLSRDFPAWKEDARFRIAVEVTIVAKGAHADADAAPVSYRTETEPFRVVARIESPAAAAATKSRQQAYKAIDKRHRRRVRAAQEGEGA